jgi:hypothetical protein
MKSVVSQGEYFARAFKIGEQVANGERPTVTVRVLLSWFYGSKRRGRWIVSLIRAALDSLAYKLSRISKKLRFFVEFLRRLQKISSKTN